MKRRWMSPARATALGAALVILSMMALPRSATTAQEPDRPSTRAALRQKIAELRSDVELREIEHEIERESVKTKLAQPVDPSDELSTLRSMFGTLTEPLDLPPGEVDPSVLEKYKELLTWLVREMGIERTSSPELAKSVEEALQSKDPDVIRKAVLECLKSGKDSYKTVRIKELATLKAAFLRHTTELWTKKLELEDLEKQYRDGR